MADNNINAHTFQVGDRVERIEDRAEVSSTVIAIIHNVGETSSGEQDDVTVEISYDEGGSGFWPSSALRFISSAQ